MKTKKINLGRVGLAPKGAYSPDATYGRMHVVTYKNTTYWSKQEGNTGHEPVGEDEWWGILVDGQAAYAGAFNADEATVRANTAAKEAERTNAAVLGAEQERESAETERNKAEEQREAQAQSNAEAEQSRAAAEQKRVEAESQRVEAEERRASEETLRAAAENTRKSDEADRIAGETSREQQEESRESAEQTRDAYEAQRKIDETKRAYEEAKRADAEDARKEAETGRVSAETGRAAAETARAKAETARADAETKRAAAETKRETDFSAKVEEVDTAVTNAKTATSEAEKVDATITDDNVFEVTGRDGAKKSLGLVGQAEADVMKKDVARIKESMGAYSDRPNITLTPKENNVAISADGVKVSKQGWAIAEFTAELGNIYLFNPGETSSDVCVFAEYIDKQETRAIDYAYTYDGSGRVLTAKATYNGKTYTYTYDYSSSVTSITDQDGNSVSSLPSVYTTTVGTYQPMTILNANAELPVDGYCRFVSNFTTASAIKIVVSYKVSSADLTMKVVRDGSTANMCSQLAKINKKVDDIASENHNITIELCAKKDTKIIVDKKTVEIKAHKAYEFHDFQLFSLAVNHAIIPNPFTNIMRFKLRTNGKTKPIEIRMCYYYGLTEENPTYNTNYGLSIEELDVSKLDTSEMIYSDLMFSEMRNIRYLDVSSWNTKNFASLFYMFRNCAKLERLDVSGWNISKVGDMNRCFDGCVSLTALDVSGWDTSKVGNIERVFGNCISLTSLTFGEGFGKMQDKCGTLELSDLSAWKDDSVKSLLTLYDRKANGMGVITIKLHANAKTVLGEDGIAQLTAKGYTIA
jgi:surface protein/YD repeat-containing protein